MIDFERNQVMRLKFMCEDAPNPDEPPSGMTLEEMYSIDARKYQENLKKQFYDLRARFRQHLDNVKETHYSDFKKVGQEKESARVATAGADASGRKIYSNMKDQVE